MAAGRREVAVVEVRRRALGALVDVAARVGEPHARGDARRAAAHARVDVRGEREVVIDIGEDVADADGRAVGVAVGVDEVERHLAVAVARADPVVVARGDGDVREHVLAFAVPAEGQPLDAQLAAHLADDAAAQLQVAWYIATRAAALR